MREPDKLWEAALTACYGDTQPVLTASERRKIGKLLKELREINATPEDLIARAKQYKKCMPPGCVMTLAAIVNHWGRLVPPKRVSTPQASYVPPTYIKPTEQGLREAFDLLPAHLRNRLRAKNGER